MITLTAEQQKEMKEVISKMGMMTNVIQKKILSEEGDKEVIKEQSDNLKLAVKNVEKSNNIFEDINVALKAILSTQEYILNNLKRAKRPSTSPIGEDTVDDRVEPKESLSEMDIPGFKTLVIAPFIAAGAAYLIDTLLSDEARQKVRAFVGGLLGIDFDDIDRKIQNFKDAVEAAAIGIGVYLTYRGISGVSRLFSGRRLPGGRYGAAAAGLTAAFGWMMLNGEGDDVLGDQAPDMSGAPRGDATIDSMSTQALLDLIAVGEGTSDDIAQSRGFESGYDVPYGFGMYAMPRKPLSQMTIGEVKQFQRELIAATRGKVPGTSQGTGAVGKYQMTQGTLASTQRALGVGDGELFDAEMQERMARHLLSIRGYERFLSSEGTEQDVARFMDQLAYEWASVRNARGQGQYAGQRGVTDVSGILRGIHQETNQPTPAESVQTPSSNQQQMMENNNVREQVPDVGVMPQPMSYYDDGEATQMNAALAVGNVTEVTSYNVMPMPTPIPSFANI